MEPRLTVQLTLKAYEALVPVATAFVEKSAVAFGLGQKEALALTLATEEVFLYLCHTSAPGTEVDIRCRSAGYGVITDLVFEGTGFQMKAFNLTATPSFEDEASIHETGLLIASRLVDRFKLEHAGARLVLTLIKDKVYAEADGQDAPVSVPVSRFVVRRPEEEEVKAAARMIHRWCGDRFNPPFTSYPQKMAEVFRAGHGDAAIAVDDAGHMGGALLWRLDRPNVVECYGPYLFHPESDPEIGVALLDHCIGEIAHTKAMGLLNRYPGRGIPQGYFESLGTQILFRTDGTPLEVNASYRHLREDRGSAVWAHPDLIPFLQSEHGRLVLPREIRKAIPDDEKGGAFSVLFGEVDRIWSRATLRPIEFGNDAAEVLGAHLRMLEKEGFSAIFFEMDLSRAWQAHFTPGLIENAFEPRFVLPYGGRGDIVVFQHRVGGPT